MRVPLSPPEVLRIPYPHALAPPYSRPLPPQVLCIPAPNVAAAEALVALFGAGQLGLAIRPLQLPIGSTDGGTGGGTGRQTAPCGGDPAWQLSVRPCMHIPHMHIPHLPLHLLKGILKKGPEPPPQSHCITAECSARPTHSAHVRGIVSFPLSPPHISMKCEWCWLCVSRWACPVHTSAASPSHSLSTRRMKPGGLGRPASSPCCAGLRPTA